MLLRLEVRVPHGARRRTATCNNLTARSALLVQLLLASDKPNFIKNKKVTVHSYVKFYALQLLFEPFSICFVVLEI